MSRLASCLGVIWLASTVVSASYTPTVNLTESWLSTYPAITYDPSWFFGFPGFTAATLNATYIYSLVQHGGGVVQSNSSSPTSVSIPFCGISVKSIGLLLSPWDENVSSVNVTLSLDETTWTIAVNATPAANLPTVNWALMNDVWVGPLGVGNTTPTQRLLKITVGGMVLATFGRVDFTTGWQTKK